LNSESFDPFVRVVEGSVGHSKKAFSMTKKKEKPVIIVSENEFTVKGPKGKVTRTFGSMPWSVAVEVGGVTLSKKRLYEVGPVLEVKRNAAVIMVDGILFNGYQVPIERR